MFNQDFYPTPLHVIEQMTEGVNLKGKTILEPSAGKGDIVDFCAGAGALNILACEINKDLQKILHTKCNLIEEDFLKVSSDQISHIDCIIMNPPFSKGAEHILHAFNIAPPGCKIISLCNASNLENSYSNYRKELLKIVESYGQWVNIGDCFADAERKTGVEVALLTINKAGQNYQSEFEGFFTDEEPQETGENGIMSYNFVRDLVNRYVAAVKLYDEQLNTGVKMNSLLNSFYGSSLSFSCSEEGKPKLRNEFKKDLQKAAWKFIFNKMNLQKFATKGLREDINKFVEQQVNIPFTMKNIYRMLEIVIGTTGQRMDKALLEVFDKLTTHHKDNRFNVEGWATNSHFLVNRKFIMPHVFTANYSGGIRTDYHGWSEPIEDLLKAMCYLTGRNYEEMTTLNDFCHNINPKWGELYHWGFFTFRAYKKGTAHFTFQSEELWGKFNQHISRLKGFPLYEPKEQSAYQNRQTGRSKKAA